MPTTTLPPWSSGQPISAQRLNDLQQRLDSLRQIRGGPGISVSQTPLGVLVSLADTASAPPTAFPIVLGQPVSTSSAGFYLGTIKLPTSTACATSPLHLPQGMADGSPCIVMNAAENGGGVPVPPGTYALGVHAGFSGTARTPLILAHLPPCSAPSVVVYLCAPNSYQSGFYDGYYLDSTGSIMTPVTVRNAAEIPFANPAAPPVHLLSTDQTPAGNVHLGLLSPGAPDNTNGALCTIDCDSPGNATGANVVSEWARGQGNGGSLDLVIRNYTGATGVASLQWDAFGHICYVAIVA